jgi:predicted Zn-dependent protease
VLGGKPLTAIRSSIVLQLVALVCLTGNAQAAALQGIDAEREEARLEREFKRAPAAEAYLQGIADRITATAPRTLPVPLRLRAIEARNPFVFCLGNGAVYVSTGLLARLENDSQVAALIAPEITASFAPNQALQAQFDERMASIWAQSCWR